MNNASKRVAKNIVILYIKMAVVAFCVFFSSRFLLQGLNVEGFGLVSLVTGVVNLFSFINISMAISVQRYIAYETGKDNLNAVSRIFATSAIIFSAVTLIIFVLLSTLGFYYFNNYMNIPPNLRSDANILFFFVMFMFLTKIFLVPNVAVLSARENFKIIVFAEIFENSMRLLAAVAIVFIPTEKRILCYGAFLFIFSLIVMLFYIGYTTKKYEECKYSRSVDKEFFGKLLSFSGWNVFNTVAVVVRLNVSPIIINIFWGIVSNAAFGIATQFVSLLNYSMRSISSALNPRIIKDYAKDDTQSLRKWIFFSAKLSFFIVLCIFAILNFETATILKLWLGTIPKYAMTFVPLYTLATLIETVSTPLMSLMQATGKLSKYTVSVSSVIVFGLALSCVLYSCGFCIESFFYVNLCISSGLLVIRMYFVGRYTKISFFDFLKNVIVPAIIPVAAIISSGYLIATLLAESVWRLIFSGVVIGSETLVLFYVFALDVNEKNLVRGLLQSKFRKTENAV